MASGQYCPMVRAIVPRGQCNQCNQNTVTKHGYCCEHIKCEETCDWYGDPDHCALARDPEEAAKLNPAAQIIQRSMRIEQIKKALADEKEKREAIKELTRISGELSKQTLHPNPGAIGQLETDLHKLLRKYSPAANAGIELFKTDKGFKFNIGARNEETSEILQILFGAIQNGHERGVD